jgi:TolB-like protein/class 3 adenylate cyclase/Tfp pilus assembly protein PilF
MASERTADLHLEIAHVLFMDVVGFSQLLINDESEILAQLNQLVRDTPHFREAEAAGKLIRLATGDGMALVFFNSPEAPVECALEISKALQSYPQIQLRMGVHSGPVNAVSDVNDRSNVTGAGINMAQRVMDCGDAGHILLSRHVAEDLEQYRQWQPCLHNLGDCEVKHGVRVHVVNLYTDELGNAEVPEKFRQANGKEQTTPVTSASDAKPAGRSRAWIVALIIVAAAAAAGSYIYSHRSSSKAPPSSAAPAVPIIPEKSNAAPSQSTVPEKSIAVLPFLDLSQAKDQEYFCDGMSEEILDALAKVEGLRVVARTSSFSFKGKSVDVSDVRKKLNVENVLEGSLRREGNRVRITAQLINTRNGFHLWSETYERELQGVFALQDEITRSIVDALKIKLAVSLPAHEQRSTEAYDLYLQGLYFSNKGSEEDLRKALNFFQSALDKDPKFSRAWTGIAKVWFFLADVYVKPLEAYPASKAAALKAIALDEKDAEAHCYLGEAKRVLDWDLAGEDAELKRALQLDPNSAPAHFFSALLPLFRGELKEGLRLVLEAEALDPLSPITSYVATAAYLANDQIDEAVMEGQRTLQLDPNYFYLDSNLAAAYREKGDFAEAIALYTKAQEATHFPSSGLAITYARMGRQIEARDILAQLLKEREKRYVSAHSIAAVYVAFGEKEEAFRWLERAFAEHSGILQWIAFLPEFHALRPDPRFTHLLRRISAPHSSILAITQTTLAETTDPNAQTRFTLKIGVKPRPGTQNGNVVIVVSFYDLTRDNKMKPTDARTGYDWLTSTRDWTDPSPKFLAATYVRPKTQMPSAQERRYGGFIVRVYFDGQLQDSRATPPELLTLFPVDTQPVAAPPNAAPTPPP